MTDIVQRKTATEMYHENLQGGWRLYLVTPPVVFPKDSVGAKTTVQTDYVIVSGANARYTGPETYIFPANGRGEIINLIELEGSFGGAIDHEQALRNAGYEIL